MKKSQQRTNAKNHFGCVSRAGGVPYFGITKSFLILKYDKNKLLQNINDFVKLAV